MASTPATVQQVKHPDADFVYNEDIASTKEPQGDKHADQVNEAVGRDFTTDEIELPDGYFKSKYFWGSMFAVGLSLSCGVAGFSFIAPLLGFVNDDIGPSPI